MKEALRSPHFVRLMVRYHPLPVLPGEEAMLNSVCSWLDLFRPWRAGAAGPAASKGQHFG